MIPFHYTYVSSDFLKRLTTLIENRDSAVLLGPRQVGKRYILARLIEQMSERNLPPPLHVECLRDNPSDQQPGGFPLYVIGKASARRLPPQSQAILDEIDQCLRSSTKSATALIANVDALSYPEARTLLTGLRTRVEGHAKQGGSLSVVLTGELDLRELVYGPMSEFNCANQFVIQGLAEDQFRQFAESYVKCLHLGFDTPDSTLPYLWQQTGGNVYLFRLILWATFEHWALKREPIPTVLRQADFVASVETQQIPWVYGPEPIRHVIQLIARNSDSWPRLHELLQQGTIPAREAAPDVFEFAGIATRKQDQLKLSSPIVTKLLKTYYTDRRFADLSARSGDWSRAFAQYQSLPKDRRTNRRPDDLTGTETAVKGLAVKIHAAAANSSSEVRDLFFKGCRYLLGVEDITYWNYSERGNYWAHSATSNWQYEPIAGSEFPSEMTKLKDMLPTHGTLALGRAAVAPPNDRQLVVGILPCVRPNAHSAVILGQLSSPAPLSPERKRLAEFLVDEFINAYKRAIDIERDRARNVIRERYNDIYDEIISSLGRDVLNVTDAVLIATKGLRTLGYRRVLICLVDSTEEFIRGVLDDSDQPAVDLASITEYWLKNPTKDVQPYVIWTGKSFIIPDALREPLVSSKALNLAGLKAMAIIPLINPQRKPIGTIHIERTDGEVPTHEEVEDLEVFGRRLAIAVEQSERVALLQGALDKQADPVFIFDRCVRLRYANQPAAKLLEVPAGWQDRTTAGAKLPQHLFELPANSARRLKRSLMASLKKGERGLSHIQFDDPLGHQVTGDVLTDAISIRLNQREEVIGALCHANDLTYLYQVFEAFWKLQRAVTTDEVISSVLLAMQKLDHAWGRLYLISEKDRDCFVSRDCFGIADEAVRQAFRSGEFQLKRRTEPGHEAWVCVTQKVPQVFCCDDKLENGKSKTTFRGLIATNVAKSQCPRELQKKPGDYWIDLPLLAGDEVLGKVTLACDPLHFKPEDYEFLKLFTTMTSNLLQAIQHRELVDRSEWIVAAAERAVSDTCHHIATVLAVFPIILQRYRSLADRCPTVTPLNKDFEHLIGQITDFIARAKARLAPVSTNRQRTQIVDVVRDVLQAAQPIGAWTIDVGDHLLEADVDAHLLGSALHELLENSRDFVSDNRQLFVSIDMKCEVRDGADWLVIDYQDNGSGVPDNLKDRIFENFFSKRSGKKTGTGLGLGFVRRVIAGHGGRISEMGIAGEGALFRIEIPQWNTEINQEVELQKGILT